MTFSPKPDKVDLVSLKEDLDSFYRRLRLRHYFYKDIDSDIESDTDETSSFRFKKKSNWQPKTRDPALESFIKAVDKRCQFVPL